MDIQKEREAFEEYIISKHKNRSPLILTQRIQHGFSENYIVQGVQDCWETWQAVKAQAVPEWISVGDSLPPVDETVLVCWDYAADIEPEKEYLTLDEDYNEYWPNCQDEPPTHWLPLPKVIKAQEQSHECPNP